MATSIMLNFRVKEHELRLIDEAAKSEGLSRSDFVRQAVNARLHQHQYAQDRT